MPPNRDLTDPGPNMDILKPKPSENLEVVVLPQEVKKSGSTIVPPELTCLICSQLFEQPKATLCGHTFCASCIDSYIADHKKCPKCGVELTQKVASVPNYTIRDVVSALKEVSSSKPSTSNGEKEGQLKLVKVSKLSLGDIERLRRALLKRKSHLISGSQDLNNSALTTEFLGELKRVKLHRKFVLEKELEILQDDINRATVKPPVGDANNNNNEAAEKKDDYQGGSSRVRSDTISSFFANDEKLKRHFEDLCRAYWNIRDPGIFGVSQNSQLEENGTRGSLEDFEQVLSEVGKCNRLKKISSLKYAVDLYSKTNLVCSVDFDRDYEYFAAGGSAGKVRIYQYNSVLTNQIGSCCPYAEFICNSTVSRVNWNPYFKNSLLSSEYNGLVRTWDAAVLSPVRILKGHEKKVWSARWSRGDSRILASASDDCTVRIWSTTSSSLPVVIKLPANACDVDFSPTDSYTIAIGCADRKMYLYDLRNPRKPTDTFIGHKRTVSGARFISSEEIMTSSVDGQVLLWKQGRTEPLRTLRGHKNEKNFIGLASHGNYMAIGSEDDRVYVYHKAIQRPLVSYQFENEESIFGGTIIADSGAGFVSALAWNEDATALLAANSSGMINVLQVE